MDTIEFNEDSLLKTLHTLADSEQDGLESGNFIPKMIWLKNDVPRLFLFPEIDGNPTNRNKLAWATQVLSVIVQADQLVFIMDTYGASQMTRTDGKPWGPGGMQYAVENNTVDAHLVHEQLTFTVAGKNGWCATGGAPYVRGDDGKITFEWDKVMVLYEGDDARTSASGFFPEMMRTAMASPMPDDVRALLDIGDQMGLSAEERDMHALCGAVKVVGAQTQVKVAIAATSEIEAEILNHSFEGWESQTIKPGSEG